MIINLGHVGLAFSKSCEAIQRPFQGAKLPVAQS